MNSVGSILCPPSLPIPLAISFLAQIVIFELQYPITIGYAIELFHFSKDCPATVTKLVETVDRGSGEVLKKNPR
jgi:elongation factor 1 alpha-like protein